MDVTKLIAVGDIQVGALMLVMSLPLILRMVPMNRSYGIRIAAAYESDERWYDINFRGGRQMAIWSWLLIIAGVIGFFVSPAHFDYFAYGSLGAAVVAIGMPVLLISRSSKRG